MRFDSSQGFTLLEALLAMTLLVSVSGALIAALSGQTSVVRTHIVRTGLDQALQIAGQEVARTVRLAGRGGLELNRALEVRTPLSSAMRVGGFSVAADTHVLIVRGALSSQIWELGLDEPLTLGDEAGQVRIRIDDRGPSGLDQGLDSLLELIGQDGSSLGEPLLLEGLDGRPRIVIPVSGFVEELEGSEGALRRLHLLARLPSESPEEIGLAALVDEVEIEAGWQPVAASRLEEARFFVRDGRGVEGVRLGAALTEARMRPGSEIVLPFGAGASWDLATEVDDFQVSLGLADDEAAGVTWNVPAETVASGGSGVDLLALDLRANALRPGRGGGGRERSLRLVVSLRNQ